MVEISRWADKFTSRDGTLTVDFSTYDNQEYEAGQQYRATLAPVTGADYGVDYAGAGPWAKEFGEEAVRFVIFGIDGPTRDAAFDLITGRAREIGEGKLWQVDEDTNRRWCYAKLAARPSYATRFDNFAETRVALRFVRLSDWYDEDLTEVSTTLTGYQKFLTVTNPGNAPVYDGIVITITATAAAGFSNLVVRNLTTGESITIPVAAAVVGAQVVIDTGQQSVTFLSGESYIGGSASYIGAMLIGGAVAGDVTHLITQGEDSPVLFHFEPGANQLEILSDGSPAATVDIDFYGGWH